LRGERQALLLRLAAQAGRLEAQLERFQQRQELMPDLPAFREAAAALQGAGNAAAANRLLEFFYVFQIENRELIPANFLGLAELRFAAGQTEEGLALLRRMALLAPQPFAAHTDAAALLAKLGRHAEAAEFLRQRVQGVPWDADAEVKLAAEEIADGAGSQAAARLTAVALSDEASYVTRVEAAKLLRAAGGASSSLGSAELSLLASAQPLSPQAASQPFFHAARLAAAEAATSNAERLRFLREAIAISPDATNMRLSLFRAARQGGEHHLAVAALLPLLDAAGLGYALRQPDSILREDTGADGNQRRQSGVFLATEMLPAGERARIAAAVADSIERIGRLQAAEMLYGLALESEPASADRPAMQQAKDRVSAALELRAENARRRPVISKNLEQDRPVRPRLAANNGGAP
jgi:tetratricopeptide (TPR) repeat protein